MKKLSLFLSANIIAINIAFSQGMAVNDTGAPSDSSAMLDVNANDKGILIPRLDYNNKPSNPANGLLIYITANGPEGDSAFYYFNGTAWKRVGEALSDIHVGAFYGGGTIFWMNASGHGLIAALADQSSSCTWSNITDVLVGTNTSDGWTNTNSIVAQSGHTNSAAAICKAYTGGGYTDWYLPATDESMSLAFSRAVIPGWGNVSGSFWTSTETSATNVTSRSFNYSNISTGNGLKTGTNKVRCIRKF